MEEKKEHQLVKGEDKKVRFKRADELKTSANDSKQQQQQQNS